MALANCHKLRGLRDRNVFFLSFGGQKSKVKGLDGHELSEGPRKNAVSSLPASAGPRRSSGCGSITPVSSLLVAVLSAGQISLSVLSK